MFIIDKKCSSTYFSFYLTLHLLLFSSDIVGQTDTLNRKDAKGNKTGWWITYLDHNLKELTSDNGAMYCKYSFYFNHHNTYNMGPIGTKEHPVEFSRTDTLSYTFQTFKLLHGEYLSRYANGQIHYQLIAKQGVITLYMEFNQSGQLKTKIDYSTTCGAPRSVCIDTYKPSRKKD